VISSGSAYGAQNALKTDKSHDWSYMDIWGGRPSDEGLYLGLSCASPSTVTTVKLVESPSNYVGAVVVEASADAGANKTWVHIMSSNLNRTPAPQEIIIPIPTASTQNTGLSGNGLIVFEVALPSVSIAVLVVSIIVVWHRMHKMGPWDPENPIQPHVQARLKKLQSRCSTPGKAGEDSQAPQAWVGRVSSLLDRSLKASEEAETLLGRAALAAAGGPQNWSVSVKQVKDFHFEHIDQLAAYRADHLLGSSCEHLCTQSPCQHEHGDADCRSATESELAEHLHLPVNMHAIVALLIKPQTRDFEGILGFWAKMNIAEPARAETFVSHCWNQAFDDFVQTLQTLQATTRVWICSFALPQNINISKILGSKPKDSPFAVALAQADKLMLALDDASVGRCYRAINTGLVLL